MKKQKILALGLSLLAVAMVGGTSAFFVTSDRAHNVITTSGVGIELIEDTEEVGVDGRPIPFTNIENAMPGDSYSKIPKIKNIDNGDAYVRMKLMASVELSSGETFKISPSLFELDISRSWSPQNGYYVYTRTLHAGETTHPLFTTVKIPKELASKYQNAKFSLTILGEAVQAKNNGTNPLDAEGWPEE